MPGPYGVNPRVNTLDLNQFQVDVENPKHSSEVYPFSSKSVFDNLPDDLLDGFIDQNWIEKGFLTGDVFLPNAVDAENRYYTQASLKFTNTTIGGNFGINSRPQFTPYADIPVKGRYPGSTEIVNVNTKGITGLGRYYSEAIDDNSQIIYLRFGVPAFNSLLSFFNNMYNTEDAMLANTGRISKIYLITRVITAAAFFVELPLLGILVYGDRMLRAFFGSSPNQYYYLKPSMQAYWGAVNTLLNIISVNLGLLPMAYEKHKIQHLQTQYETPTSVLEALHKEIPEIFNSEYGIDAFAIATKTQRLANLAYEYQYQKYNHLSNTQKLTNAQKLVGISNNRNIGNTKNIFGNSLLDSAVNYFTLGDYNVGKKDENIKAYTIKKQPMGFIDYSKMVHKTKYYQGKTTNSKTAGMPPSESIPLVNANTGKEQTYKEAQKDIDGLGNMLEAEWDQGAAFAIFRVNFTGSGSLSYDASVGQPGIAAKYNGFASNMRSYKFDTDDYDLGITDGVLPWLTSKLKDAALGAGSGFGDITGIHIDGLVNALLGNVKIEVPDYWEDSSVSFPTSNYEMELVSPYGNPFSMIQNIYLPLSMIMAGSLPLATGRTSYTSPFLCQLFDRGHNQIGLGMINSVSIEYGTTNLPYTKWGRPLGMNVSFSVVNLSKFMAMPLVAGTLYGVGNTFFDNMNQDNPLANFLAIITGRDIYSQIYAVPRAFLNLNVAIKQVYTFTSSAYWAGYLHQSMSSGVLSYLIIPKLLGALNPGISLPNQSQGNLGYVNPMNGVLGT